MKLTVLLSLLCLTCFSQTVKPDTVTIAGVGDIMMGSNYPNGGNLPPANGSLLLKEVSDILRSSDVMMGNLEGTLLDKGGIAKTCRDPKVCYVFRSPEAYVQNLVDAGFDVMSVANNHAGDFGWEGKQRTEKTLQEAGLQFAGQANKPSVIFEKNGVKFGFAAFAPNTGCANINDLVTAKKIVAQLDSLCDIVIVSFHGGAEGPQHQHVTRKTEVFYGENRGNVYQFAHQMIDAGADVVLGHGPHVTRAVETYKNKFIAYSLGNFCTYGGINVSGISGVAPIVKVFTDIHGNFYQAQIVSTYQQFYSTVMLDERKQALKRIQALTREDFPESTLLIDDNGWVKKSTR
jgi:poly-gamma-glutamate capsule biosynthesis protein CapA/YwtB (metallophosphatase superfamily)